MGLRVIIILTCLGLIQAKLINLSCKQVQQFVDGHNYRRLQLAKGQVSGQPAASEMNYIVWDHELAAKAGKWASRNQFMHNPDRTVGSGRFRTGENLYWYGTTDSAYKLSPQAALNSWFSENKYYTYGPLTDQDFDGSSEDIGHYTQMVWSNSTYVGCGISKYTSDDDWTNFLVVCDYGPAGNYIGEVPYETGRASRKLTCGIDDCSERYGDNC